MINPYPVEQAKNNSSRCYLSTILDELSKKINEKIEKASKDGYYHAAIIYREHCTRELKELDNIINIIEQKYLEAGYEDIDIYWTITKDCTNLIKYIIKIYW